MLTEVWKDVKGFYFNYQVSNLGNVKNVDKNFILKQHSIWNGYLRVDLCIGYDATSGISKKKHILVHRLVATTFLEIPLNKGIVNHIDGNKQNNLLNNLELVSASENVQHRMNVLNKPCGHTGKFNWMSKPVNMFDINLNFIKSFESIGQAAKELSIKSKTISRICNGQKGSINNLIFKFI